MTLSTLRPTPVTALMMISALYLAAVFWIKTERLEADNQALTTQLTKLNASVEQVQNVAQARLKSVTALREQARLHPKASLEDTLRAIRTALAQALPGVQLEVTTRAAAVQNTSAGVAVLPVAVVMRLEDETLLDTIKGIEGLRPGMVISQLSVRKVELPKGAPSGSIPLAEATISALVMIDASATGVQK